MSKSIRIALIVIAVLCIPPIIYPQLAMGGSSADPVALLIVTGLAAILWPGSKKDKTDSDR